MFGVRMDVLDISHCQLVGREPKIEKSKSVCITNNPLARVY